MRLADLYEHCVERFDGHKDAEQSKARLKEAFRIIGLNKRVEDFTTFDYDRLVKELRRRELKNATMNRYLASASAALKWAQERDLIAKLPKVPWRKKEAVETVFCLPDEGQKIATQVASYGLETHAILIRVLIDTGMRAGELNAIKPHHIDAAGWVTIEINKTDKPRTVPLSNDLVEPLREIVAKGDLPTYRSIVWYFKKAKADLGLRSKGGLHSLRHGVGTVLAGKHVNQKVIKEYLGHRSIATTERYVHVNDEMLKAAFDVMKGNKKA